MNANQRETLTSPRPSPLPPRERRGRIISRHAANQRLSSAQRPLNFESTYGGCSLSPGGEGQGEGERIKPAHPTTDTSLRPFQGIA